jgi:hypothetical protein
VRARRRYASRAYLRYTSLFIVSTAMKVGSRESGVGQRDLGRARMSSGLAFALIPAVILLAGCGGGSGSGGSQNAAATGPSTPTQAARASSAKQSSTTSAATKAAKPSSKTRSSARNGLPAKPGPAKKIESCLTAGKASITYTPKTHGYGAVVANGPGGAQIMILAAPSAAEAKDFLRALKPSQPIETHSANGGKTLVMLAKNPPPGDRKLALSCGAAR